MRLIDAESGLAALIARRSATPATRPGPDDRRPPLHLRHHRQARGAMLTHRRLASERGDAGGPVGHRGVGRVAACAADLSRPRAFVAANTSFLAGVRMVFCRASRGGRHRATHGGRDGLHGRADPLCVAAGRAGAQRGGGPMRLFVSGFPRRCRPTSGRRSGARPGTRSWNATA